MESNNSYQVNQEILIAAKKGNLVQVKKLTNLYPELVNFFDIDTGYSPLLFAVQEGHLEIVKFLLQQQVFVNRASFKEEYPIFEALKNGHEDIALCLIDNGLNMLIKDKEGWTILMHAAYQGMERVVNLIIKEHAFLLSICCNKGHNALTKAYLAGYIDIVEVFKKAGLSLANTLNIKRDPNTLLNNLEKIRNIKGLGEQKKLDLALRFAVRNQMILEIRKLIELGANPNCTYDDNLKPLFFCAHQGNLNSFDELYSHKACLGERNYAGKTVLHLAIYYQNIPLVEKLIELEKEKFSLSTMDIVSPKETLNPLLLAIIYDRTKVLEHFLTRMSSGLLDSIKSNYLLIHYAVGFGCYKSIETLLEYNFDVNQKNQLGETPLILLAKLSVNLNKPEHQNTLMNIAKLFIEKGADLDAVSTGKTALEFAREANKKELVDILTKNMSKAAPLIFSANVVECATKFSDSVERRKIKSQSVPVKFR